MTDGEVEGLRITIRWVEDELDFCKSEIDVLLDEKVELERELKKLIKRLDKLTTSATGHKPVTTTHERAKR